MKIKERGRRLKGFDRLIATRCDCVKKKYNDVVVIRCLLARAQKPVFSAVASKVASTLYVPSYTCLL